METEFIERQRRQLIPLLLAKLNKYHSGIRSRGFKYKLVESHPSKNNTKYQGYDCLTQFKQGSTEESDIVLVLSFCCFSRSCFS